MHGNQLRSKTWRRSSAPPADANVSPSALNDQEPSLTMLMVLMFGHLLLGLTPRGGILATLYAVGTVMFGMFLAVRSKNPYWPLMAAAYIAGVEVFWRMSKAGVFWEFGKYAVCLVLILGMIRQNRLKVPLVPLVYVILLIPAVVATAVGFEFYTSRRLISQNFSGPFTLFICAAYCHGLVLRKPELIRVGFALLLPLITIATYATRGIAASGLEWGTESNAAASGGFGPNQVSAMLGLGAFLAVVIIVISRPLKLRTMAAILGLWFLGQAALTFSRTGVYLALLSCFSAGMFMLQDRKARMKFIGGILAIALVSGLVIYPALNRMTGGNLGARFSETQLSNRGEIAARDLRVFKDNLLVGVGVGQAMFHRHDLSAAHTEYTRMLAEHGLIGAAALLLLLGGLSLRVWQQRGMGRAIAVGALAWSLFFMGVSAMRLAAPSLMIGLVFAWLALDTPLVALRLRGFRTRKRSSYPQPRTALPQPGR